MSFAVDGKIGTRWRSWNAENGPFGHPLGPEEDVPGRNGRRQRFENGEIAWSPDQDMVISVYQLRNEAFFEWEKTEFDYDNFRYDISFNGVSQTQGRWQYRDIDNTHIWVRLQGFGEYVFIVKGCSGDDCEQGFTIPVRVWLGRLAIQPPPDLLFAVTGLIEERWHELGAWEGPLGKPTTAETIRADGAREQEFEGGSITTAPRFGPQMVVAAYQRHDYIEFNTIEVNWGGADRAFNAFRVDIYKKNGQKLWGEVVWYALNIEWARPGIGSGQFVFSDAVKKSGQGEELFFYIFPIIHESFFSPSTSSFPEGTPTPDAPPPGSTPPVKVKLKLGEKDVRLKLLDQGSSPIEAFVFATQVLRANAIAAHYARTRPLHVAFSKEAEADENTTIQLIAHLQMVLIDRDFRVPGELPSRILIPIKLRQLLSGTMGTELKEMSVDLTPIIIKLFGATTLAVLAAALAVLSDGIELAELKLVGRGGNYDFAIKGLMVIAYRYRSLLNDEILSFILQNLVPNQLHGGHDLKIEFHQLKLVVDIPIISDISIPDLLPDIPESENHLLMIESGRYLVNQLQFERTGDEKYNNKTNLLRNWLLDHLQRLAKHDFLEFNARPYNRFSIHALLNLYDFDLDPEKRIKTAAQIVLDYIFVKFAISSNRQRRVSPFRRLLERTNTPVTINDLVTDDNGDPMTGFFLIFTGLTDKAGIPTQPFPDSWAFNALIAGLSTYRPPVAAYILALTSYPPVLHRFYHGTRPQLQASADIADGGVEIYYKSPSFLLTAGGMFLNSGYGWDEFFTQRYKDTAIAQSTTLIPTRIDVKFADLIRFDPYSFDPADSDTRQAVNTGVAQGFACGVNLRPFPKKIFQDSTSHAPALASHDGQLFLTWKDADNQKLNIAKVYLTDVLGLNGIEGLEGKVTLEDTSDQSPALISHDGRLFLAWKGAGNENLNLMFSKDNGATFRRKTTFGQTSDFAPALASHDEVLLLAWTDTDDGNLTIAKVAFTPQGSFLVDKVVLSDISDQPPALASHEGRLFLAWKGTDNGHLNLAFSTDNVITNAITFQGKRTFEDTSSSHSPALASHNGNLFLAWKGDENEDISVAKVTFWASTAGGFGIEGLSDKVDLGVQGISSDEAPALASHGGRLFLAWKGAGNDNLNLRSSRDGSFQEGPWFWGNLKHLGFYVAVYRTPVASEDIPDPVPESVGFVYAMEAQEGAMSFEEFQNLTLARNTTLPPTLDIAGFHIFHSADNKRFRFTLSHVTTDRSKYAPLVTLLDEANPVVDFRSLPLVDGPYLKSLGHDAIDVIIEIRYPDPECNTPLTLNYSDPLNPRRLDNDLACPKPWIERSQALQQVAQQLLTLSDQLVSEGKLPDAIKAAREVVNVLRPFQPPASEQASYLHMLAKSLRTVALRLIEAQRISEVSAPALESIQVYRQAVAAGAEVPSIFHELQQLSSRLAGVEDLTAEAVSAEQVAIEILRPFQPPAAERAAYLNRLAGSLLNLVVRLIEARRISEVSAPALESIQVYRQAVAAGAEVPSIFHELQQLSNRLAGVKELTAEAVSAEQAVIEILRPFQPPAAERAAYLNRLAGSLRTVALRLIEAQRISEVSAPALESIQVYRQAAVAGAEATGIFHELQQLSGRLAGEELTAEAVSAEQAAIEILRPFQPPVAERAAHLNRLAGSLLNLVVRLIEAQRSSEILAPALESIQVYRQAAAAGAEATGIARNLLTLSAWLANARFSTEANAAAAAAEEILA